MTFWAVAQTEPLRERLAAEELQQAGFVAYLPRIRFRHRHRWRITPLFPSYVFLQISDQWWAARWCRGVLRLLGPDDSPPSQLPEHVITEIRAKEKNGFVVLRKPPRLQKGQRVRIVGGRFNGQLAFFEGQNRHERIKVLMQILGALAVVELGQHDKVEPLQDVAVGR